MKDSIHQYFQLGTISWMSYPTQDPVETIRTIARDDFFDAIELTSSGDETVRQSALPLLEQSHLKVCYGAQPALLGTGLNPNDLCEEGRIKAEQVLCHAVDEAKAWGAQAMSFLAGKWSPETCEQSFSQLVKTTRAVCSYAAQKDIFVQLEVFDYDMDKAALIGPAPYAAEFAAEIRKTHHNFGLLVDLSHFPTTYETSRFVIQTLRPYITHFHIGNAVVKKGCEAYGDQHPRFGFPNSANDVPQLLEFFRVLKQEGFFCPQSPYVLSFEVKPWKEEDPAIVLANTKRVIRRAWAMLED